MLIINHQFPRRQSFSEINELLRGLLGVMSHHSHIFNCFQINLKKVTSGFFENQFAMF